MADPTQFMFKHRDLVIAMIKAQDVHSGLWQLTINFGFSAANTGPNSDDINPTAIIPIMNVGLQRVDSILSPSITVDAAIENPA